MMLSLELRMVTAVCLATLARCAAAPSWKTTANVTLTVGKVDVHSVSLHWVASDPKTVQSYEVHHSDGKTEVRVRGENAMATSATIYLPESAHRYNVCVAAVMVNSSQPPVMGCAEIRTLELIRADSLLVVLLVIAFIMTLVALAYAAWRYRVYKHALERGYKRSADDKAEAAYLTAHDRDCGA